MFFAGERKKIDVIAAHIQSIARNDLAEAEAVAALTSERSADGFIVFGEVAAPEASDARKYYNIAYKDVTLNEFRVQMTPSIVTIVGVLRVDEYGEFKILDRDFHELDTNTSFEFDDSASGLVQRQDVERAEQTKISCNII